MYFYGDCSKSGSGVGIVFKIPNSIIYPHTISLKFLCTNNEAKYEEPIQGMNLVVHMRIEHLVITSDLELVINNIKKRYKIKKKRN